MLRDLNHANSKVDQIRIVSEEYDFGSTFIFSVYLPNAAF